MTSSKLVYSTGDGRICPTCAKPIAQCICNQSTQVQPSTDKHVTLWRERKGRAGKEVSVIKGLPLNTIELQILASTLKSHCGSGGTVAHGNIEIQGDHRKTLKALLTEKGYDVKLAGG